MNRLLLLLAVAFASFAAQADFEVWFLRHGETSWNRAKILQGSVAYTALTPRGVRMAERTAEGLSRAGIRFDRVYASPYRRARQTADIIAGRQGLVPVADDRIREMCFGRYEGVRYVKGSYADDNLRNFFEGTGPYVPQGEGAESFEQVGARLRDFLQRELVPQDGKVGRVLCVAHSLVLKSLLRELFGDAVPASAKATLQRNCCVHIIRYADGKFTLKETGRIFYDPAEFESASLPRTVAHRGAGDLHMPEASLPAYSNAVETVSDIVKLDLQRTKDGCIVLSHDHDLKRSMGWDKPIYKLAYQDIFTNRCFRPVGGYARERIVRLDEALRIVRPIPEIWLDFKQFSPDFAEKVLEEVRHAEIDFSRLMVATFSKKALEYFRDRHPEIRRVGHVKAGKSREEVLAFRDELKLFGVNLPVSRRQTSVADISFFHENGLWVALWFVQTEQIAAEYRDSGADAFVTDHVTRIRKVLDGLGRNP